MKVSKYDKGTGRILALYDVPNPDDQCGESHGFIEGWYAQDEFYVEHGKAVKRPVMQLRLDNPEIVADGIGTATVSGIPEQTEVAITGPVGSPDAMENIYMVDEGSISMSVALPGEYRIVVSSWPHKEWETVIHAS